MIGIIVIICEVSVLKVIGVINAHYKRLIKEEKGRMTNKSLDYDYIVSSEDDFDYVCDEYSYDL